VIALIVSYLFVNNINVIVVVSALIFFATGCIFPMSMGQGLSFFRHIAGTATATMYLINILITSLTSFLMSFINITNVATMVWIYFILMALCLLVYWKFLKA
jgi:hypothetical protein